LAAEEADLPPGDFFAQLEVPGYKLLRLIGRGSMSAVYEARKINTGNHVAIRFKQFGAEFSHSLVRENREIAERLSRLRHRNLVAVLDAGEVSIIPYSVMEFVAGGSLADRPSGKEDSVTTTARLIHTLALALQVAHGHNIVHGNLKPSKVLLAADGTPKISGFVVLRRQPTRAFELTEGETIRTMAQPLGMGTLRYIAPEQLSGRVGDVGPATDVYALGLIMYERLTGWLPFRGATLWEMFAQILREPVQFPRELRPDIPRDLETICLGCLARELSHRYATAGALAEDLDRFLSGKPLALFAPHMQDAAVARGQKVGGRQRFWAIVKSWFAPRQ
jgi:serine/threonine protein kinase